MFKSIKLRNFKGFQNSDIEISELTILTGANNSGKSSLTNSILTILQSNIFRLELSLNGMYVNLGDYEDVINNRDINNFLEIGYEVASFNNSFFVNSKWQFDEIRKLAKFHSLEVRGTCLTLKVSAASKSKAHVKLDYMPEHDMLLKTDKDKSLENIFENVRTELFNRLINDKGFSVDLFSEKITNKWSFEEELQIGDRTLQLMLINKVPYQIIRILDLLFLETNNIKEKSSFIGSLRLPPERTYYENSNSDIEVSPTGENFNDLIVLWKNRNDKKFNELIKVMKKLNLAESLQTKRITGGRYELQVRPKKNSPFSSLTDVGFGVSQFLPIIVTDIQKGKNSSLFIAQPETHLHPSIQADFCDYISDQIKKRNKRYFIETHSEYFLNRLRLNIVNGSIDPKKVKVYYLVNTGADTEIHLIDFMKNGAIKNAPEDFFKTYLMDTMDIAINAVNKD